jgi:ubiquinone/menaquinone biosynthesis C-methylase UbiE
METGTERYYRARAAEYDLVYDKPERRPDLARLREWLPGLLAGRRVLEVAAGTGYWTDVLAERAMSVVATDVNAATLDVAMGRRAWPETVRFVEADAFGLGRVEGVFDAAFAGFFWSHVRLQDLDRFLAGVAGRLEPGATVVFVDNRFVDGSNHRSARTDADGNTYQQRTLAGGTTWEVLKNFPTAELVRQRLRTVSQNVTVTQLEYYWVAVCELDRGV